MAQTYDPGAAAEALAAIRRQREELASRVITPVSYHPVLGRLTGGLVASYSLRSPLVTVAALAVYCLGVALLVGAYQRLTGVWIQGLRAGRTRPVVVWMLAGAYAVGGVAAWWEFVEGHRGAMVAAGSIIAVLIAIGGRRFDQVYRPELRETL